MANFRRMSTVFKVAFLSTLIALLGACLPQVENETSEETTEIEKPVLGPASLAEEFWRAELVDFVLRKFEGSQCSSQEVKLTFSDSSFQLFNTVGGAVAAATEGSLIEVGAGQFNEIIKVSGKRQLSIVSNCQAEVRGFKIEGSRKILIKGFRVNAKGRGKSAVHIEGRSKAKKNRNIKIELSEIYGAEDGHGILVERHNSNIEIDTVYIHSNGRDGINFDRAHDSDSVVRNSVIAHQGRNGVRIDKKKKLRLENNFIIDNGRSLFSLERFGVYREKGWFKKAKGAKKVTLIGNTITSNNGISVFDPGIRDIGNAKGILDSTDQNNITTSGEEGEGVTKLDENDFPNIRIGIENGQVTKNPTIQIPVLVQDRSAVEVRVSQNTQDLLFTEDFAFTLNATLIEGMNNFVIRATDINGNEGYLTFGVKFDPDSPDIVLPVARCNAGEVYATDASGAEQSFASLQEAIDQAGENWSIFVGPGEFNEVLFVDGKSQLNVKSLCQAQVKGFELVNSAYVTIEGFHIDPEGGRHPGVRLHGDRLKFSRSRRGKRFRKIDQDNEHITIKNNEITGTRYPYSCIYVGRGNKDTYIFNNYLHGCGKDGINLENLAGGPHLIEKNTISSNAYNGIEVGFSQIVTIQDNIIIDNGTAPGWWGGRYGLYVHRGFGWIKTRAQNVTLIGNTIVSNNGRVRSGRSSRDIANYDRILDATDGSNYSTDGSEGPGFNPLNDTDQPTLNLSSTGGFLTPSPLFTLAVSVMDMSPVTTEILQNGSVIASSRLFQFQKSITLVEGVNNIEVRATDISGNAVSQFLDPITLDTIPPVLSDFSPSEGETIYTNANAVFVSGKANEKIRSAKVNDAFLTVLADEQEFSGTFFVPFSMTSTLNYVAEDLVGNVGTKTFDVHIVVDKVAPVVDLTGQEDILTNQSAYSFDVSVTEENPVVVEVFQNGAKIQESTEKSFTVSATLEEGGNGFEVFATDAAGNVSEFVSLNNINLDTVPPVLTVTSPDNGELITLLNFQVEGSSNESLQSVTAVGTNLNVSGSSFVGEVEAPREGPLDLVIVGKDLAGNETSLTVPVQISLRLLNIDLVLAEPSPNPGRVNIVGGVGATRPNSLVTVKRGIFSSDSTTSNEKGQFLIETDNFSQVTIEVENGGESESGELTFNVETKLSGIVRDIEDQALPQVTVRIQGTNRSTQTNGSGVFMFDEPPTGLQTLEIDGSTVPPEVVGNDRQFSEIRVKVNIGVGQQNVIERPIFFPALLMDGTETVIVSGGGAVVTSPHAPGVRLTIPSGVVTFPDGTDSGAINLSVVDSEKATLPVLAAAVPDEVISLEPSGITFSEPVELTIPNDNELPEGVDFAILSLNSQTGQWEVDGVATVDSGGQTITTKPGQGITHFSEIYAVPTNPEIRRLGDVSQVGIDAFSGSLTREIRLPSFKSLGQDVSPGLIYKSAWANPTAMVNHFIDVPPREFSLTRDESGQGLDVCNVIGSEQCMQDYSNYWNFVKYTFKQEFKSAYQPESIDGTVFVGDLTADVKVPDSSEGIPFSEVPTSVKAEALTGLPNQSVVSFAMTLKDEETGNYLESGLYGTLGRYSIRLKRLTITSTRFVADYDRTFRTLFGSKRVTQTDVLVDDPGTVESEVLEDALLHDIGGELIVKNQVESEFGRGWDVMGVKKLLNPGSNSIVLDKGDGTTELYRLNDNITTVWQNGDSNLEIDKAVDFANLPQVKLGVYRKSQKDTFLADLDLTNSSSGISLSESVSGLTGNLYNTNHYWCAEPTGALLSSGQIRPWNFERYTYKQKVRINSVVSQGSATVFTDDLGHQLFISSGGGNTPVLRTLEAAPKMSSYGSGQSFQSQAAMNQVCQSFSGEDCTLAERSTSRLCFTNLGAANSNIVGVCREDNIAARIDPLLLSRGFYTGTFLGAFGTGIQSGLIHYVFQGRVDPIANPGLNYSYQGLPPCKPSLVSWFPTSLRNGRRVDQFNSGNRAVASASKLNNPQDTVLDSNGNVLIADKGNNRVRRYNISTDQLETFAGNGQTNGLGDGGLAINASIVTPNSLAVDRDGSVYIATGDNKIKKVGPSGVISTYGGLGQGVDSADTEIHVSQLALNNPSGMTIDRDRGLLYVADTGNHRVLRVDLNTNQAISIAGNRTCSVDPGDGGSALNASLCSPSRLGIGPDGNLYIWDTGRQSIRRVDFNSAGGAVFVSSSQDNSSLEKKADGTFVLAMRDGRESEFSSNGLQLSEKDRVGRQTIFSYDTESRLVGFTDTAGRETTFNYSGASLASVLDPAGRQTTFTYSGDELSVVEFPDGSVISYQYDSKGMIIEERDKRGNDTSYSYNQYNRLYQTERPNGSVVQGEDLESKAAGNNSSSQNPKQLFSLGLGDNDIYDGVVDPRNIETRFERDINGYVTLFEDGEGRQFEIQRDSLGKPLKITRPDDSTSVFTYDSETQELLKREDSSGLTITNEYNDFGQVVRTTGDDQVQIENEYSGTTGLLLSRKIQSEVKEINEYNSSGLVSRKTLPVSGGQDIVLDFSYDSKGNLTRRGVSSGEETLFEYDLAGNVTKKSERQNTGIFKETLYSYDLFNRLKTVTLPDATVTTYNYLSTGELEEVVDHEGNKISFEYDEIGQLTKKTDQRGKVITRSYDPNGNVLSMMDPNGNVTSFEYDNLDRVTKKALVDDVYDFDYDVRGNVKTVSNKNSLISNSYDERDRLVQTAISGQGAMSGYPALTQTYSYDLASNLTRITDTRGGDTAYSYDSQNRLTGLSNHKNESFGFEYDQNDRLSRITRPGSETLFALNDSSFITEVTHKAGGVNRAIANYVRNDLGFATQLTTLSGVHSYGYDQNSQLTSVSNPAGSHPSLQAESYSYDSIGNRTSDHGGNYTYNLDKQLLNEDYRHFYLYDENGNLKQKTNKSDGAVTNYEYTSENQLKRIIYFESSTGPTLKEVSFEYDALGRRMQKQVIDSVNSAHSKTRQYAYDGNEIILEFNESDDVLARYTHSRLRTDDVLSVDVTSDGVSAGLANSAGSYFYLKDALGTVTDVLDASGAHKQRYNYSAYGVLLNLQDSAGVDITSSPVLSTAYTYTGREYDAETGMYYYRARYYDPSTGRFIRRDPNPGASSLPLTVVNAYAYAANSPNYFTDPNGEFICGGLCIALAVSFTVGATVAAFQDGATLGSVLLGGAFAAGSTLAVAAGAAAAISLSGAAIGTGAAIAAGAAGGALANTAFGLLLGVTDPGSLALIALAGGISGGFIGKFGLGLNKGTAEENVTTAVDAKNRTLTPGLPDSRDFIKETFRPDGSGGFTNGITPPQPTQPPVLVPGPL